MILKHYKSLPSIQFSSMINKLHIMVYVRMYNNFADTVLTEVTYYFIFCYAGSERKVHIWFVFLEQAWSNLYKHAQQLAKKPPAKNLDIDKLILSCLCIRFKLFEASIWVLHYYLCLLHKRENSCLYAFFLEVKRIKGLFFLPRVIDKVRKCGSAKEYGGCPK